MYVCRCDGTKCPANVSFRAMHRLYSCCYHCDVSQRAVPTAAAAAATTTWLLDRLHPLRCARILCNYYTTPRMTVSTPKSQGCVKPALPSTADRHASIALSHTIIGCYCCKENTKKIWECHRGLEASDAFSVLALSQHSQIMYHILEEFAYAVFMPFEFAVQADMFCQQQLLQYNTKTPLVSGTI